MQLEINEVTLPEKISFNYEELKTALSDKVEQYKTIVYTEDQIKEARSDRAELNKLSKALNDERLRMEREYMRPFADFKDKINELIGIIKEPVGMIDRQVKAYEDKCKEEKRIRIFDFWNEIEKKPSWLKLEAFFDEKWLNASVSMKSVQDEITAKITQVENDLVTLADLPEFGFEATEVYKTSLDILKALNEGRRLSEIQKKKLEAEERARKAEEDRIQREAEQAAYEEVKAEIESKKVETKAEEKPAATWISFKACLTIDQAVELKEFFATRGILFSRV